MGIIRAACVLLHAQHPVERTGGISHDGWALSQCSEMPRVLCTWYCTETEPLAGLEISDASSLYLSGF